MLTRSLVTGTVTIVGFLVLVATTELFYFGSPEGAQNGGEVFASLGGGALTLLTWAGVGWCVARTARALRLTRFSVLVGMAGPVGAIVAFAVTIDLDGWATGFGALAFAAASAGVLATLRGRRSAGAGPVTGTESHPPLHLPA